MTFLADAVREFLALTLRVLPYFLIGAGTGAVMQTFGAAWSERLFGRDRRTSLPAAVAAGALLPGCSCATMPMAAGMQRTGGPRRGVLAAFIFVSPLLSPITVALTWSMLGWRMSLARVLASTTGALVFGAVLNRFESWFNKGTSAQPSADPLPIAGGAPAVCCDEGAPPVGTAGRRLAANFRNIMRSVTPFFLLGMAAAAAISVFVPEGAVPRILGGSAGPGAFLLAAVVGIPLYVCEGEEVPLTFALLRAGLGAGPAFTFLVGSVGTCLPTILMARNIVGTRATTFYAGWWIAFAIGSGIVFQLWA